MTCLTHGRSVGSLPETHIKAHSKAMFYGMPFIIQPLLLTECNGNPHQQPHEYGEERISLVPLNFLYFLINNNTSTRTLSNRIGQQAKICSLWDVYHYQWYRFFVFRVNDSNHNCSLFLRFGDPWLTYHGEHVNDHQKRGSHTLCLGLLLVSQSSHVSSRNANSSNWLYTYIVSFVMLHWLSGPPLN